MKSARTMVMGLATLVAVAAATRASAAVSKASLKCRTTIAKKASSAKPAGLIKQGLSALDGCHGKRDKGATQTDCNVVDLASPGAKFAAFVGAFCKADDPVRSNYAQHDPAAQVRTAVEAALSASGAALQGTPSISADKAKRKCHAAIGAGQIIHLAHHQLREVHEHHRFR